MSVDTDKIDKTFCASPWVHFKLGKSGAFYPCRWSSCGPTEKHHISSMSPIEYFNSDEMNEFRLGMLTGKTSPVCQKCYYEDAHGKLSGRQKQLYRFGLSATVSDGWDSSSGKDEFEYSNLNNGRTRLTPIDFQIVTSNICNSSCIMCSPTSSSKISKEITASPVFRSLQKMPVVVQPWRLTESDVEVMIQDMLKIPDINYVHFVGGEPLYDGVFGMFMERLIETKLSDRIICGTAINATVIDADILSQMAKFKSFHLGISMDSVTSLNDYIRYPSKITNILENIRIITDFTKSASGIFLHFRPTPNIFTVMELDKLFGFFIEQGITWETCDILSWPLYLRIELLPDDLRELAILRLKRLVVKYEIPHIIGNEPDTRNPANAKRVMSNSIYSYINFLENYDVPETIESDRYDLVTALHEHEKTRGNCILDHAPEFESFLRKYGYEGKSTRP